MNTGKVVRLSETRSGLDVILLLEGGRIRVRLGRYFTTTDLGILSTLGVNHEHETFGKRNLVEQMFRSLKLRLASMDKHFPHNASKATIMRWVKAFFTLYLQQGE